MSIISQGVEGAIKGIGGIADDLFTSDEERGNVELQKQAQRINYLVSVASTEMEKVKEQVSVIKAEANGQSWLQRNWRPVTMMVFVGIIANNYILYPYLSLFWSEAPKLPPLSQDMWELLKIGMGGYVLGRSAEKGIKSWQEGKVKQEEVRNFSYHGATYGMFGPSVGNPPQNKM
jgi:hypothetical protein